jgi:hypothetical protein
VKKLVSCNSIHVINEKSIPDNTINFRVNYQCDQNTLDPYKYMDNRGVTIWGDTIGVSLTLNPGQTIPIQFTCTVPRCYSMADNCNVFFKAYSDQTSGPKATLTYGLNSHTLNPSTCLLSGNGESGWQAVELGNYNLEHYPEVWYYDNGRNTISFGNAGSNTIKIDGLQIIRVYQMCSLYCDLHGQCDGSTICSGTVGVTCEQGTTTDSTGDFAQRHDYPCSYRACGTKSYSYAQDYTFGQKTISPGDCRAWVFDWTDYSQYNYSGSQYCLFNFNPVNGTSSNQSTMTLDAYINDEKFSTYSFIDYAYSAFSPSVNLNTVNSYRDYGLNTVVLVNTSSGSIYMGDVAINIYRIYETNNICTPCTSCQLACELCQECETGCYMGQGCWPCYGFCMTCVTACELCESGYDWGEFCQSGFTWPCEVCEDQCYTSCITCQPCEGCQACEYACQGCEITCEVCQPCENCQSGCLTCEPGCYDCQSCYNCEPSCYDFQICYLCQENCYDCETCYNLQ